MAKVLVSMSDKFLERINEVADNEQRTRSELIREAASRLHQTLILYKHKKSGRYSEHVRRINRLKKIRP